MLKCSCSFCGPRSVHRSIKIAAFKTFWAKRFFIMFANQKPFKNRQLSIVMESEIHQLASLCPPMVTISLSAHSIQFCFCLRGFGFVGHRMVREWQSYTFCGYAGAGDDLRRGRERDRATTNNIIINVLDVSSLLCMHSSKHRNFYSSHRPNSIIITGASSAGNACDCVPRKKPTGIR